MNPELLQPEPTEAQSDPMNPLAELIPTFHRAAEWHNPCKKVKEESKKRRKMAKSSRRINRRK